MADPNGFQITAASFNPANADLTVSLSRTATSGIDNVMFYVNTTNNSGDNGTYVYQYIYSAHGYPYYFTALTDTITINPLDLTKYGGQGTDDTNGQIGVDAINSDNLYIRVITHTGDGGIYNSDYFLMTIGSGGGSGGVAPCFFGNARVLTPTGYRRIDSLRTGDVVLTPCG